MTKYLIVGLIVIVAIAFLLNKNGMTLNVSPSASGGTSSTPNSGNPFLSDVESLLSGGSTSSNSGNSTPAASTGMLGAISNAVSSVVSSVTGSTPAKTTTSTPAVTSTSLLPAGTSQVGTQVAIDKSAFSAPISQMPISNPSPAVTSTVSKTAVATPASSLPLKSAGQLAILSKGFSNRQL